jgi:hypothetical protein
MPNPSPRPRLISTIGSLSPGKYQLSCNFLVRRIKSGNAASMGLKHMAFEILFFVELIVLDGNLRLAVAVSKAISLAG